MIEILKNEGNLVALKMSGKLHDADYEEFVPLIESAAAKGRLHLLVEMTDFHGWDMPALWDDMKLEKTLGDKIAKLAMVGDKKWETWMAKICKPFTSARIAYFDAGKEQDAWKWVQDGLQDYAVD